MEKDNNPQNQPAFPTTYKKKVSDEKSFANGGHEYKLVEAYKDGMTLRDYFAAKAMQGVIASDWDNILGGKKALAKHAYQMADEMLKAREL